MNLQILTDAELIRHALNEQNGLTTSQLEIELTKRLERKSEQYRVLQTEIRKVYHQLDELLTDENE